MAAISLDHLRAKGAEQIAVDLRARKRVQTAVRVLSLQRGVLRFELRLEKTDSVLKFVFLGAKALNLTEDISAARTATVALRLHVQPATRVAGEWLGALAFAAAPTLEFRVSAI